MSRVEDTHDNTQAYFDNEAKNGHQSMELSLGVISQMLIEINESLAIICDKLGNNDSIA